MPLSSPRVPVLPKHTTCPAFAQSITAKNTSDVLDRSPPLRRARKLSCAAQGRPDAASRNARVEFRISEEPLQPGVLLLKVLETLRLVDPKPTELLLMDAPG
jgi:hypothetical protein